jgi:hypothetical protein
VKCFEAGAVLAPQGPLVKAELPRGISPGLMRLKISLTIIPYPEMTCLNMSSTTKVDAMNIELEERVRHLAYDIWELEGRPDGRAHEHWERALRQFDCAAEIPIAPAEAKAASKKPVSRSVSKTPAPPKRKSARSPQVTFN